LKSAWNKHNYFNVTDFTMPSFVSEIVIEFFQNEQWSFSKILTEIDKNQS